MLYDADEGVGFVLEHRVVVQHHQLAHAWRISTSSRPIPVPSAGPCQARQYQQLISDVGT